MECVFNIAVPIALVNILMNAKAWERLDADGEKEKDAMFGAVKLTDCLSEFKLTETLDEDNKWYCSQCKEHVIATKTMEVFRTPPIMVITLKRFKTGRSKYGFAVGAEKLQTVVDFPLEGLDMRDYELCSEQKQSAKLIYDCFAVSNHHGNVGFGHYTAFAKSVIDNKWREYDDSNVKDVPRPESTVISGSAYSLFYRLRNHTDLNNPDYDKLKLVPDETYMNSQKKD